MTLLANRNRIRRRCTRSEDREVAGNPSPTLATAEVRSRGEFGNSRIILRVLAESQGTGRCILYRIVSWDSGGNPLDCVVRLF